MAKYTYFVFNFLASAIDIFKNNPSQIRRKFLKKFPKDKFGRYMFQTSDFV